MDPFTAAALLGLITTVIGTGGKLTNTAMQQKLANMKAENRAPGAPGGGALPRTGGGDCFKLTRIDCSDGGKS